MKNPIETVGMVGFGAMGQFMAEHMFEGCEVVAHDPQSNNESSASVAMVSLEEAASSDAVILATPASTLPRVIDTIKRSDTFKIDETLLVDVCSVKEWPTQLFNRLIPNHHQTLHCHPLFGPESAKKSLRGHRLIVTESAGDRAAELVGRWQQLGLKIIEMTAEEHDRQMAAVQAVPFILGRIATKLGLDDAMALQTPSRLAVRKLEWLDQVQSEELLRTIVAFNPQALRMLEGVIEAALELQDEQVGRDPHYLDNRYMQRSPA
jgi:prephenate dehydrogenase